MTRQARPFLATAALAVLFAAGTVSAAIRPPHDGQDRGDHRQARHQDKQDAREDRREVRQDARQDRREVRQDAHQDRREVRQDVHQDRREDRQAFRQDRREDRQAFRQDRREDAQDFRQDRREVRQDVRQDRREDRVRMQQPRREVVRPVVVQQRHDRGDRRDDRRIAYDRYRAGYDRRSRDFRVRVIPRYYVRPAHYRYFYGGQWFNTSNYGADVLRQAVSWGYQEGIRAGRADRYDGWGADFRDSIAWRNGGFGYGGRYVSRADYDYYFRQGFQRGYDDGYYGRMQYGRYDRNDDGAMIAEAVLVAILGFQLLR